ncbi:YigZ family protein [Guptibacillus algicola]|uniref:YigZ family protein n=1 Tax=Guptibacillus algicola TaxID=225844 RepID=UPI001CD7B673|nr:YigZ family protein [Alkalihalobacillus algicola]MCA0986853.1 YigZ family protein [Alkalihalobacillus algicola]
MLNSYLTVKGEGEYEMVIQKSRFIAHVKRTTTEEEAQAFIQHIKKTHNNATHNCSAYLIGEQDNIQKANDDGEPSGTAGVPMLEVLKKKQLKDTTVVVTRYFGGIKLGAGGLIRAYGQTVSEGINATGIVERKLMTEIQTNIYYTLLGKVENEIRSSNYILKKINYLENVQVIVIVERGEEESFIEWMTNLTSGKGTISVHNQLYIEVNFPS